MKIENSLIFFRHYKQFSELLSEFLIFVQAFSLLNLFSEQSKYKKQL